MFYTRFACLVTGLFGVHSILSVELPQACCSCSVEEGTINSLLSNISSTDPNVHIEICIWWFLEMRVHPNHPILTIKFVDLQICIEKYRTSRCHFRRTRWQRWARRGRWWLPPPLGRWHDGQRPPPVKMKARSLEGPGKEAGLVVLIILNYRLNDGE